MYFIYIKFLMYGKNLIHCLSHGEMKPIHI